MLMNSKLPNPVFLLLLSLLTMLLGCKPGVPGDVIQPDEMGEILYDCQLAEAMAQQSSDYAYNQVMYREAIFKKHGITSADFDSSMVYYMRHTEELHKIYEALADRLHDDALALGASESEVNRYSSVSSSGDTANVWNGAKSLLLLPVPPYNSSSFEILADTTYHSGDSFLLTFRCNYIYQEGMRDGVALLAVRYANDSVATHVAHMPSSNEYTLRIDNTAGLGVKAVKGYFYLGKGGSGNAATTMKIMSVYDIHLVRMRSNVKQKTVGQPATDKENQGGDSTLTPMPAEIKQEMPVQHELKPKTDNPVSLPNNMATPIKMERMNKVPLQKVR